MNTDYYNIKKYSTSSSDSSESNYSTKSNFSIKSDNNSRLNDYTFCYNLCCLCSPSRKKIEIKKKFVI